MLLRYLSLLCLCSSSLFAASFTLDVACTIKDDARLIKINNMHVDIDENKACVLALKEENLDFDFSVLWHNEESVAVQTIITRRASESNKNTILAQPVLITSFGQSATVTLGEIKNKDAENEETYHFELTLIPSKNTN